ncbi:hypothetical protein P7K49_004398 [Saguinus oedipus]|uniref:Uncharacterized protein n=1 Tax=Saguinus oedipus TaxID=9490 RepID=A0ABQ9W7A2_SAGOE|nr:hypothetical protein P7K49_004398 [Saguinus oedipus]
MATAASPQMQKEGATLQRGHSSISTDAEGGRHTASPQMQKEGPTLQCGHSSISTDAEGGRHTAAWPQQHLHRRRRRAPHCSVATAASPQTQKEGSTLQRGHSSISTHTEGGRHPAARP